MTATCIYRVDEDLLELLDQRLGPPLDSYVRGWQVWLEANGPDGMRLEWRLHPPGGFRMPRGVNHHDLFDEVLQELSERGPDAMRLGGEQRSLGDIWEVLEVFPIDHDVDPRALAAAVAKAIGGQYPDACGQVDHDQLGTLFTARRGNFSVGQALLEQLGG